MNCDKIQAFYMRMSIFREMSRGGEKNPSTHNPTLLTECPLSRLATLHCCPGRAAAALQLFMRTLMILFNDPYWSDSRLYTFSSLGTNRARIVNVLKNGLWGREGGLWRISQCLHNSRATGASARSVAHARPRLAPFFAFLLSSRAETHHTSLYALANCSLYSVLHQHTKWITWLL